MLLAVKVTVLEAVVGLVPKAAVIPVGRPLAASVTEPVNPFAGATATVLAAVAACATETLAGEEDRVKLGAAVTVRAIVVEAVRAPLVPVTVTV